MPQFECVREYGVFLVPHFVLTPILTRTNAEYPRFFFLYDHRLGCLTKCGMNSSGLVEEFRGCCEHGIRTSDSIKELLNLT